MDIEKLIEQLRKSADFEDYPIVASFAAIIEKKYLREAADVLSTMKKYCDSVCGHLNEAEELNRKVQAENEKLRAELEQVKNERDSAKATLHWLKLHGQKEG